MITTLCVEKPDADLQDALIESADGSGLSMPLVLDRLMALVVFTLIEESDSFQEPGRGIGLARRVALLENVAQHRIEETARRRTIQAEYNAKHGITPESIQKSIGTLEYQMAEADYLTIPVAAESQVRYEKPQALEATIRQLEEEMKAAAKLLAFEKAAEFRDRIKALKLKELEVGA